MKFTSPVSANLTLGKLYDLAQVEKAVDLLQASGVEVTSLSMSVSAVVAPVEKPAA